MSQPHLDANCRISNSKGTIIAFLLQKSCKFTTSPIVLWSIYLGESRLVSTALCLVLLKEYNMNFPHQDAM